MFFRSKSLRLLIVLLFLVLGGVLWYRSLSEAQQRFVKNFVSQIPDLPGRYFA